jgi:predicted transcriptional regulator
MEYTQYIATDLKVLNLKDSFKKAKMLFDSGSFSHLPILDQNHFVGVLAENDIQNIDFIEDAIESHRYLILHFCTLKTEVWVDLVKLFATHQANMLPVVDDKQHYLGYYDLNDVLFLFLETPFLSENGYIIVVEKQISEYSFSEIAQIVEVNNAKLLGAFISDRNGDTIQITLKITDHDISNTLQSFRRYNYQIVIGDKNDQYVEQLKDRSDYLQKYLNL